VDQARFQEAEQAYAQGDYRSAAKEFLEAAGEGPGSGPGLHMAGNSLMRLGRFDDAIVAYSAALDDHTYDRLGTVAANLGAAYRKTDRVEEALAAYTAALDESDYAPRYKAMQGRAGALYDLGRLEEAAAAYRSAALEPDNPDPGKALNNLGLTYMALGRTEDAVEAYAAALDMDSYTNKGRAAANLGLALSRLGRYEEAVDAFEQAEGHGFELSEGFRQAYRVSTDAVAAARIAETTVEAPVEAPPGEEESATEGAFGEDEALLESDFFTRTEEDMRRLDKEAKREAKTGREGTRGLVGRIAIVVVLVAVILVALWGAYYTGFGYPTQGSTVDGLMEAYAAGEPVDGYWGGAVAAADVEKEMAKLPPNHTEYTIDAVTRGPQDSTVKITVTLEEGAPLRYDILLAREGVGWKVIGVENDWRSTGGGT
jgi:tetratricopeptide (TPR) repeat protein